MDTKKIIYLSEYLKVLDASSQIDCQEVNWLLSHSIIITGSVINPPKNGYIASIILLKITSYLYVVVDCNSVYHIFTKDGYTRFYLCPEVASKIQEILGTPRQEVYKGAHVSFCKFWPYAAPRQAFIQTERAECVSPMYYKLVIDGSKQYMQPIARKFENSCYAGCLRNVHFTDGYKHNLLLTRGLQALTCLVGISMHAREVLLESDAKGDLNFDRFSTLVQTYRSKMEHAICTLLDEYLEHVAVYVEANETPLNLLMPSKKTQANLQRKEVVFFEDRLKEMITHSRIIKELLDIHWDFPLLIEEYEPFRFALEAEEALKYGIPIERNYIHPVVQLDESAQHDESSASPAPPSKPKPAPIPPQMSGDLEESTQLSYEYIYQAATELTYKYNIACFKHLPPKAPVCESLREAIIHFKNAQDKWKQAVVNDYQCNTDDYYKTLNWLHNIHKDIEKGYGPTLDTYADHLPTLISNEHKETIHKNLSTHFGDYISDLTDEEMMLLTSIEYLLVCSECVTENKNLKID